MQLVWLPEQAMEDGKGVLADGTRYVRDSGEEFGANGFWQRWTRLRGVSAAGKVRMGRAPARISGMTWTLGTLYFDHSVACPKACMRVSSWPFCRVCRKEIVARGL